MKRDLSYVIFRCPGGLPERLYLLGLSSHSPKTSEAARLAQKADEDKDGSFYDERVDAIDTIARPKWANGAVVIASSRECARLHRALSACSIILDCRYVVVPEEYASRVFLSMADAASREDGKVGNKLKMVVNKLQAVTIDPEDMSEYEQHAVALRLPLAADLLKDPSVEKWWETDLDTIVAPEMNEFLRTRMKSWSYDFQENTPVQKGPFPHVAPATIEKWGEKSDPTARQHDKWQNSYAGGATRDHTKEQYWSRAAYKDRWNSEDWSNKPWVAQTYGQQHAEQQHDLAGGAAQPAQQPSAWQSRAWQQWHTSV